MNKYIIEFIGTFFLVLIIALSGNPLAIGVGLTALVYMGGYISGAHYNPAITLGFLLCKKITPLVAIKYMAIQFIAAIIAAAVYFYVIHQAFIPSISTSTTFGPAVLLEILFTFLLVSVVLNTAATNKTKGNNYYGIAIGFTLMAAAFAAGPVSGGAFNPAVGLGPLLFDFSSISAHMQSFLVYLIGPFCGGILASIIYKITHE